MLDLIISRFYGLLKSLNYHHPIHPLMVHVTVGLIVGAFILSVLGRVRRRPELLHSAWHCMMIALIFAVPTMTTGLMDWRHSYSGILIFPFQIKFLLAATLLGMLAMGFMLGRRSNGKIPAMIIVYSFCLVAVAGLGYFGGEIVYGGRKAATVEQSHPGQGIYVENCAGCHPNGGTSLVSGLPVRNSPRISSLESFILWIRAPKSPMPAFPNTIISDKEAEALFDYVNKVLNNP